MLEWIKSSLAPSAHSPIPPPSSTRSLLDSSTRSLLPSSRSLLPSDSSSRSLLDRRLQSLQHTDNEETSRRVRAVSEQYEVDTDDRETRSRSQSSVEGYGDKARIWAPDMPRTPWVLTERVALSKDKTRVTLLFTETGQIKSFLREETRGFHESHLGAGVEDLGTLNDLHEASALAVLANRFKKDFVYTNIGDVLISINPYCVLPNAFPIPFDLKQPHLFQVAQKVFQDLSKSHSILINGESGSGKTVAAGHVVRFLSQQKSSASAEVRRAVAQTTPLLEAFGNANTSANPNSSRFGKYMQILFAGSKEIVGLKMTHFLLETNRVVARASGERNFHIFYDICFGLDSKSKSALFISNDPNDHAYLKGFTLVNAAEDDELAKRFLEITAAMEAVGITEAQRKGIWTALALILRLGDVVFEETTNDACRVSKGVKEIASIMCVEEKALESALTTRIIETGKAHDVTEIPLTMHGAQESCSGLARALYSTVFDWIVERANHGTFSKEFSASVGVLDMMGFEVLPVGVQNSFEQLLINYSAETLQAVFNQAVLKSEKRFYDEEGVDSSKLQLDDNSRLLRMFNDGIFSVLDDVSILGTADEHVLLLKIQEKNKAVPEFCVDPFNPSDRFIVKHFAGPVSYSANGFLDKNRGTFFNVMRRLLSKGKGFACEDLLKSEAANSSSSISSKRATVSKKFRDSLQTMMEMIRSTQCHFVRCIRPNSTSVPKEFNALMVNDQLLRLGVYEAVRLRREGFPVRVPFEDIVDRYRILVTSKNVNTDKEKCAIILSKGLGQASRGVKWELGQKNHAFLSARAFIELDLDVARRKRDEEIRLENIARIERERLERQAAEAAAAAAKRAAEEDAKRRAAEEAERKRLERMREEEARLRKQREAEEAKRADEERKRRFVAATKIQSIVRMRINFTRFKVLVIEHRRVHAVIILQKHARGLLVRWRMATLKKNTKPFRKALRPGEVVLKSTLVVRMQAHELFRAVDSIMGAGGRVAGVARKATIDLNTLIVPIAHHNYPITLGLQEKKRFNLLLTRGPQGTSLLLVDPKKFAVKDEIMITQRLAAAAPVAKTSGLGAGMRRRLSNLSMAGVAATAAATADDTTRLRAVASSTRDFVVAKGKSEWVLTDLLGGAGQWVQLLKDDGKKIPVVCDVLTTDFFYRDANTDSAGRIIVKQGELSIKSTNLHDANNWDKRWFVLDERYLMIYKGQTNVLPVLEINLDDHVEVRVAPKGSEIKPFVISLCVSMDDEDEARDYRLQCATQVEFDAWLAGLSVALDRAKKQAAEERANLGASLAGDTDHLLVRLIMKQAEHGTGAEATRKIVENHKKTSPTSASTASTNTKKKGFDAQAFKKAFKEADKVVLANYD